MDTLIDKKGWLHCPKCGQRTEQKIGPDTIAHRWPMYCPKCGWESVVNVFNGKVELASSEEKGGAP